MKFSNEQLIKAAECKSVEELIALAREEGIEIPEEMAEKFLASLSDAELDLNDLSTVTGGLPPEQCGAYMCGWNC